MPDALATSKPTLVERLALGPVLCAEGYVFELERRGYVQAGAFVPEVVLDHPEAVIELHREFLRVGSDIVEALTYYAHRDKLRIVGREESLAAMNRQALALARAVAAEGDALLAGNVCNTNVYLPDDAASAREVRAMFEEQVGWAAEAKVDFVIGETFAFLGEALLALEAIKGAGLPAVITFAVHRSGRLRDGATPVEACQRLREAGAEVVGLNCIRGPRTMMPLLETIRAAVDGPLAALPVPYRTVPGMPTFQSLREESFCCPLHETAFPTALDPFTCTRYEMADFARAALALGIRYLGSCCGTGPHHVRAMAEALGKRPAAGRYSADLSKHYALGDAALLRAHNRAFAAEL